MNLFAAYGIKKLQIFLTNCEVAPEVHRSLFGPEFHNPISDQNEGIF
jgi:hypothetical protein